MRFGYIPAISASLLFVLAGCSSTGQSLSPAGQNVSGQSAQTAGIGGLARVPSSTHVSPDGHGKKTKLVYISDNSQILVFDAQSGKQTDSITDGISGPTGLNVNAKGDLYVANSSNNTGTVYPFGTKSPSITYTGDTNPWDIDRCTDGTAYIADLSGDNVAVYENGSETPTRYFEDSDAEYFFDSECGPSDHVYVAYYSRSTGKTQVKKYGPYGKGKPVLLPMQGGFRSPMIVDIHDDVIFGNVDDETIEFWAPGGTKPYKTITTFDQPGWVIQYLRFAAGEKKLWAQISEGGGTYAYEIDVASGAIEITLPYVSKGGPGIAVYPSDAFP
jgi:hypothetical protein